MKTNKYVNNNTLNSFVLKNHLLLCNKDYMVKMYLQQKITYVYFLCNLEYLIKEDPISIFVMDENLSKIHTVINEYRKSNFKDKTLTDLTNDFIKELNNLKTKINRDVIEDYLYLQKVDRVWGGKEEDIPSLMAFDYELIYTLESDIDLSELDPSKVLSSTFYLMNTYKSLYEDSPKYVNKTLNYLETYKNPEYESIKKNKIAQKIYKKLGKINIKNNK